MDIMDKYKIQSSIDDVIIILDSAPIKYDFMPETNIVQIANRIPIAHLAIERGLKVLITEGGGNYNNIHCLGELFEELTGCDAESAIFLESAFNDAVEFYGYDIKRVGLEQFQSIEEYFSKTGDKRAFELYRYWAIGEEPKGDSPIPFVSLDIHREILCALSCMFSVDDRITVTERVEFEVANSVSEIREFSEIPDERPMNELLPRYRIWLESNQGSLRYALKKAFRNGFKAQNNDLYWSMNLQNAYSELSISEDPAVRYFVGTFSYLPKGSQIQDQYANPRVQWLDKLCRRGFVKTPACYELGYIERYTDGAWGIIPSEPGLQKRTAIAEDLKDAKHYLVNRLTCKLPISVNDKSKDLRIVGEPRTSGNAHWTSESDNQARATIKLRFWDNKHGIVPEDQVSFEFLPRRRTMDRLYKGAVTRAEGQLVTIVGTEVYT